MALIIDLRDGQLGEVASSIAPLNQAVSVGGVDVRKVTFVAVGVGRARSLRSRCVLTRTTIGLHTRAAATDFRTARLLGVRANRVIAFAVVFSGLLAAACAVLLTVQNPFVQPDFRPRGHDHRPRRRCRRRD
jgi:branched-chain amino acid transport system permease protein